MRSNHLGISTSHSRTLIKLDEMGAEFDASTKRWKEDLQTHSLRTQVLTEAQSFLSCSKECIPEGLTTTDVSALDLSFPNFCSLNSIGKSQLTPESCSIELNTSLCSGADTAVDLNDDSEIINSLIGNNTINMDKLTYHLNQKFQDLSTVHEVIQLIERELGNNAFSDAGLKKLLSELESQKPESYQIVGDNVDLHVKVKHMTSERQNKSIHCFALNAIKDRIDGRHLSDDKPSRDILEMENIEFLPSVTDNQDLLYDLIPLCARIGIEKLPALKCFSNVKISHLPHRYTQEMQQKSEQVNFSNCLSISFAIKRHLLGQVQMQY